MATLVEMIQQARLIAVVRLENYTHALEIARALVAGGITVIEFTLTGAGATTAITQVRTALGERVQVGVGTVLDVEDAEEAIAAGTQFVVTPLVRPRVIAACHTHHIPVIGGALTPSEVYNTFEAGADMIKLFPARLGGPQYVRDILAPLPHMQIVATGGITPQQAGAYLEAGVVAVGLGGNLVSAQAVVTQNWSQITIQADACVQAVRG